MSNASDKTLEFQCPKCARRLKASSKAAGKRLKCPSCGQPVKVPGAGQNATADDDWLNLESPTASSSPSAASPPRSGTVSAGASSERSTPARSTTSNPNPSPAKSPATAANSTSVKAPTVSPGAGGSGNADDHLKTSIFDDDLPELAELEAPRPRVELGGIFGLEDLEGLVPPVAPPKATTEAKPVEPSKSEPVKSRRVELQQLANQQYRVACPACGTPQYVTVADKGKSVKCPDCFLDFKIPPPPPGWKPSDKPAHKTFSTELAVQSAAETERDSARARAHANEYLRNAEQELNESEIDSLYQGDFDTQSFMRRTFGFCYDVAALAQVIAHSVLFAIGFAVASWCTQMIPESPGFVLISGLGVPLVFIIVGFPMFAAAMTLLESVANGEPRVREWPGFSFFDHIGELILFVVALAAAAAPGFMLGGLLGRTGGMAWMLIFSTLFSTFVLFPIILLSMLDNDSIFGFVSAEVLKSLSSGYEAWGVYYFKTFIAFSIIFIAWAVLLSSHPMLAAIGGAMLPWLVFFTSQQLGVLAGDISEHLSIALPERPPKDQESDEQV